MEWIELLNWLLGLLTIIAGGGWFINWKANKRKANGEAKQVEADAFKSMQDAYQQTLDDVNKTLNEVRAERDHYKDDRNILRKENDEMRTRYNQLEDKVARLGRRLDCLSPFLCGVVGCMHRKKVSLMENIDDNSFTTVEERESLNNENKDGV